MVEVPSNKYSHIKTALIRSKRQTPDAPFLDGDKKGKLKNTDRLRQVKEKIMKDDDLRAYFSILRDAVLSSGWELIGDNQSKIKECYERLEELSFRKKIKKVLFSGLCLLHSYMELERTKNNKVVGIYPVDATEVYPKLQANGKILSYHQDIKVGKDKKSDNTINWTLDDMAHFTFDDQFSEYYNLDIIATIEDIYKLKQSIYKHLINMFDHNVFKLHFHGVNVSKSDIENFTDMIFENYRDNTGISVTVGKEEMIAKKYVEESVVLPLIELLNMIRNKYLTLLRVPPIVAGSVDNSNRSNSDTQADVALKLRLDGIREDFEDDMNSDFLPKLGYKDIKFRFKDQDLREVKKLSEILSTLIGSGADKKKINKWLKELPYGLPNNLFKEEEKKDNPIQTTENEVDIPQNSPLFDSRKPQDNFEDKEFGKLNDEKQESA